MALTFLVTGANRGIGLEFVRQLSERGERVIATARTPERAQALQALEQAHRGRVELVACDVADDASVAALGQRLDQLDVLINNAGVFGSEAPLGALRFDEVLQTLNVNGVGALRVVQAALPALRRGTGRRIVQITSGLGSIGENASGGYTDYRMSKAAMNMLAMNLAQELGPEGFVSIALQPGWVQTDMGGAGAPTRVEDSVAGMLKVIDELSAKDNARFFGWNGRECAW